MWHINFDKIKISIQIGSINYYSTILNNIHTKHNTQNQCHTILYSFLDNWYDVFSNELFVFYSKHKLLLNLFDTSSFKINNRRYNFNYSIRKSGKLLNN